MPQGPSQEAAAVLLIQASMRGSISRRQTQQAHAKPRKAGTEGRKKKRRPPVAALERQVEEEHAARVQRSASDTHVGH
jgi:hypothetical protein